MIDISIRNFPRSSFSSHNFLLKKDKNFLLPLLRLMLVRRVII